MINIKITMNNGQEYNVRNQIANDVKEFIRRAFIPYGVQLDWQGWPSGLRREI